MLVIVKRADWGAKPPKKAYTPHTPKKQTVHHTASAPARAFEGAQSVRRIQNQHQDDRDWIDIGYHFLIDGNGVIYEGRPINVVGAHVKSNNTGNIGISLIGNYDTTVVPEAMWASLVKLSTWISETYNIPASEIRGHRDQQSTICPGGNLYALLPFLRERVAAGGALTAEAKDPIVLAPVDQPWRYLPKNVPVKPVAANIPVGTGSQTQRTVVRVEQQGIGIGFLVIAFLLVLMLMLDD